MSKAQVKVVWLLPMEDPVDLVPVSVDSADCQLYHNLDRDINW